MKPRLFSAGVKVLVLAICLPLLAAAQTPAAAPAYLSPEVHADDSVTLRLRAPNAQKVDVVLEGAVTPMQQDGEGLWSVTTAVLAPEIYAYRFMVDGTPT